MEQELKRILAIDYGEKRIGIAVSDPMQIIATPLMTLPNNKDFLLELKKIVVEKNVELILVGMPIKEDGSESRLKKEIDNFFQQIKNELKVEIILYDERYSSKIAEQQILESVLKKSKRRDKGLIDRSAAAVFLQNYLDKKRLNYK